MKRPCGVVSFRVCLKRQARAIPPGLFLLLLPLMPRRVAAVVVWAARWGWGHGLPLRGLGIFSAWQHGPLPGQ